MHGHSDNVVTEEQDRVEVRETIQSALSVCGYPDWTIRSVREKMVNKQPKERKPKSEEKDKSRGMVVIPYVQGLTEKLSRIFRKHNISTAMKPHTTMRRLLVSPKDKLEPREGVYTISYKNCPGIYIGETK